MFLREHFWLLISRTTRSSSLRPNSFGIESGLLLFADDSITKVVVDAPSGHPISDAAPPPPPLETVSVSPRFVSVCHL